MHITFVSLFPEIYTSFLNTSLIKKAHESNLITHAFVNPRDFCTDKHKQVDDEIYGG
jgi:tRNA (guanine37-N1)-methyltransferase